MGAGGSGSGFSLPCRSLIDKRQATAYKELSTVNLLYGISLQTRMPDPPVGLLLLSVEGSLLSKVDCLLGNR
jgi:hypothetical protein